MNYLGGEHNGRVATWKVISDLKMPPNPTREEYKAVYYTSEGDVLKFQAFYLSWKNVSCNLETVNQVAQSTGACCAAGARGTTCPAVASGIQLASGGEWGHAKTPGTYKKNPVKGILEASGNLYWPTLSSYWHYKNLHLHFFVTLPTGCHAEDVSVMIPSQKKVCIIHKWPELIFYPD